MTPPLMYSFRGIPGKLTAYPPSRRGPLVTPLWIAPAEAYCSDCAWPHACAAAEACQRRAMGEVRGRALGFVTRRRGADLTLPNLFSSGPNGTACHSGHSRSFCQPLPQSKDGDTETAGAIPPVSRPGGASGPVSVPFQGPDRELSFGASADAHGVKVRGTVLLWLFSALSIVAERLRPRRGACEARQGRDGTRFRLFARSASEGPSK